MICKTNGFIGAGIPPFVAETLFLEGLAPSSIHLLMTSFCSWSMGPPLGGIKGHFIFRQVKNSV